MSQSRVGSRPGWAGLAFVLTVLCLARPGWTRDTERWLLIPPERQMGAGDTDGAIRLEVGRALRVEKVRVADCRLGKAFIDYPVDGRLDTSAYHGAVNEWPAHAFTGHQYGFNEGNGLHITLADAGGFDAVLFRGDFRGIMYRDALPFHPGAAAEEICNVSSTAYAFRRVFPQRLELSRVDLFYTGRRTRAGDLCDASFLRIERGPQRASGGGLAVGEALPGSGPFRRWVTKRFGKDGRLYSLGQGKSQAVHLPGREFIHLLTPPQDPAYGLDAVTCRWRVGTVDEPTLLTFRIQDPLDPRREIMGVDCVLDRPGAYELTLNFPDQVFLPSNLGAVPLIYGPPLAPPAHLWLSIGAGGPVALADVEVQIERIPRAEALPQAVAWRKFMLKGQFYIMSEPRPWMGLYAEAEKAGDDGTGIDIRAWLAVLGDSGKRGSRYRPKLENLFETVEQCRVLAPDDDVVRQYHEWIFQALTRSWPWPVSLSVVPGAPRWAVLLHQAYLGVRSIPEWWIANRLAPESGELGSLVADDVDMMQQWASYPLIEAAPLGEAMRDMGRKLADQAIKLNLSEDYLNVFEHSPHHSYEEGINQLALNAWWNYGDPVHYERAMRAAESISRLMVDAGCGHRHFRSTNIEALDLYASRPGETAGHTLPVLLHLAYEVAWYNRNPAALDFYSQWADAWIEHQEVGNYATMIDVKTGEVAEARKDGVGLGGYRTQGVAWLGIYELTKDPRFLKPFFMAFDAGHKAIRHEWGGLGRSPHFLDHLRTKDALGMLPAYAYYLATGKTERLEASLEEALREWQRFGTMYTGAEPITDRVFLTPFRDVFNCYLGNYAARNVFPHGSAVSYEGLGKDFAALVGPSDEQSLKVTFFSFAQEPLRGRMRVWRLDHGRYTVRVGPDANGDGVLDRVEQEETMVLYRYAPVAVLLPPGRQTLIEVEQIQPLDDLLDRPDLALSPLDTTRDVTITWQYDSLVRVRIHNIGAGPAANIEVALVRKGEKIRTLILSGIEAPLDMKPRVAVAHFTDVLVGDEIVVDPDNRIPEIAEHNNRLIVGESGLVRPLS